MPGSLPTPFCSLTRGVSRTLSTPMTNAPNVDRLPQRAFPSERTVFRARRWFSLARTDTIFVAAGRTDAFNLEQKKATLWRVSAGSRILRPRELTIQRKAIQRKLRVRSCAAQEWNTTPMPSLVAPVGLTSREPRTQLPSNSQRPTLARLRFTGAVLDIRVGQEIERSALVA